MVDSEITDCPNCARKLRGPGRRVWMRCPPDAGGCGHEWLWQPGQRGDATELDFRCGKTGGRFRVHFVRPTTAEKFRIDGIAMRDAPKAAVVPYGEEAKPVERVARSFNADIFDLAGWRCPDCSHPGVGRTSLFVHCTKCGELVCGHNIIDIRGGGSTFKCYPACGNSGELSGRKIESYAEPGVTTVKKDPPRLPPGQGGPDGKGAPRLEPPSNPRIGKQ